MRINGIFLFIILNLFREELLRGYSKVDIQKDLVSKTRDLKESEILKQQSQVMNGNQN